MKIFIMIILFTYGTYLASEHYVEYRNQKINIAGMDFVTEKQVWEKIDFDKVWIPIEKE